MKRRLFNLAAAVSLGMMLAVTALWVRSYWVVDHLMRYDRSGSAIGSFSCRGGLALFYQPQKTYIVSASEWNFFTAEASEGWLEWGGALTFAASSQEPQDKTTNYQVCFPHWLVGALCAVSAATCAYARGRRYSTGACAVCGYDLRATPERCPECGTAIGTAVGTAVAPKPAEAAA